MRKYNCIINMGDKLTSEHKKILIAENKEKYGLSVDEINSIVVDKALPDACSRVVTIDQIMGNRSKLSTIEKIIKLKKLEDAIIRKIDYIQKKNIFRPTQAAVSFRAKKDGTYVFKEKTFFTKCVMFQS